MKLMASREVFMTPVSGARSQPKPVTRPEGVRDSDNADLRSGAE